MRLIPAPDGNESTEPGDPCADAQRPGSPTVSGMVTAGATLLLLAVTTVVLLIPTVFYLRPIPPDADGVTLCLPLIGPVQRFREGLGREQEELVYIHEGVHAEQCRTYGPAWYAQQAATREGRLTLEVQALCAEVEVLSLRGADRRRLLVWTEETLATEYFGEGGMARREISAAVEAVCGGMLGE